MESDLTQLENYYNAFVKKDSGVMPDFSQLDPVTRGIISGILGYKMYEARQKVEKAKADFVKAFLPVN